MKALVFCTYCIHNILQLLPPSLPEAKKLKSPTCPTSNTHIFTHKHHAEPAQMMMSSALGHAHTSSARVRFHPTTRERTSLEPMGGK